MATRDLRDESCVNDRKRFTAALDELQAAMIVIPSEVSTCRSSPTSGRSASAGFLTRWRKRVRHEVAVKEIARCFLAGAGLTIPGELARVTGLSRPEAGSAIARSSRKGLRGCSHQVCTNWSILLVMTFEDVKAVALTLPEVEASEKYDGSPV